MSSENPTKTKKISALKSQDFRYHCSTFLKSLLHFPVIYFQSKAYLHELYKFLQTYPRSGMIAGSQQAVMVNSIDHYWEDSLKRGLVDLNFVYPVEQLSQIQEVEIFNEQNQKISALILKQPASQKWVIGLHGWTENKYLALRQTYLYSQLGYNVLTFDGKGHGNSYGDFTDVGYSTADDLMTVLKWLTTTEIVERYGVVGNSMGGAGAMKFVEDFGYQDPKLKFVVNDAGFNNLLIEFRFLMQNNFHQPWWKISYGINRFFRQELNINFKTYDLMKKIPLVKEVPILFIHGTDDDFVPVFNSKEFYRAKVESEVETKSEMLIVEGIKHVRMISDANSAYVGTITKFLTMIGEIDVQSPTNLN